MAKFKLRPGLLFFCDGQPGSHATMFGPRGEKLEPRGDRNLFNDDTHDYQWAFELRTMPVDGQRFVFATGDRQVLGIAKNMEIGRAPTQDAIVDRDEADKPLRVRQPLVVVQHVRPTERSSTKSRILFVNPSVPYNQWDCYKAGVMNEASFSAHGAAYVSATLKNEGHTCWMVDLRSLSSWKHVEDTLREQEYDVAFLGFLSIDAFNAACVVRLLKELHPTKPVVVGGLHVSIAKESIFPRPDLIEHYCADNYGIAPDVFKQFLAWKNEEKFSSERFPLADYVILDDGEIAARDLVADLAAGRIPKGRTIDGGAVPMEVARHMDRDLFDLEVEAFSPILPFQPTPMVTVTWARGCPFHCRYCFTSGMIVHTEYGFETIADIVRRDESVRVVQADGTLGRASTFSERSYRGSIIRVVAHYMNQPIEATPNHKVKTATPAGVLIDKEIAGLTLADRLFVPSPKGESVPFVDVAELMRQGGDEPQAIGTSIRLRDGKTSIPAQISWSDDLLFLLGIYLAEGCVTYAEKRPNSAAVAFSFGGHEVHLQKKVTDLLKSVFGVEARAQEQRTGIQVWCGSALVSKVFEYLCGAHANSKRLHRWILGLTDKQFMKVVTAWLIGDGNPGAENHSNSFASASTVSQSLAWGMWTRLLGCGVAANIHKKPRPAACQEIEGRTVEVEEFFYEVGFGASKASEDLVHAAFGERGRVPKKLMFPLEFCDGGAFLPLKSLESAYCNDPVFNMEVTPNHTYTVNGCAVHNCNLASQLSNTNVRQKPVEMVEEELDILHERFGGRLGSLMIHDDLTFHPKHIEQWCELLLRKYGPIPIWMQTRSDWVVSRYKRDRPFWDLLCRAGLTWVSVGYESGAQRVLDFMKKDSTVENNVECGKILDEYGVNSFANFLWGVPTETPDEAEETVRLVEQIRPGYLSGSVYCNYPGTQMAIECEEKGWLAKGEVYERSHLPWQVRVKGIDYAHAFDCRNRAGAYSNYLRMPKLLDEDRQRELAETSRGLPIHGAGEG